MLYINPVRKTKRTHLSLHRFPSTMIKASSACLNNYAVKVSNSCCLSSPLIPISSTQNAVICLYKTKLSTQKHLLIAVSWCKTFVGKCLSIDIVDHLHPAIKVSFDYRFFKKTKDHRTVESCGSKIEVFWDLSAAKYNFGPEPNSDFYVAVMVDSELGLFLGETRQVLQTASMAEFSLASRTEHLYGNTQYSTRAKFCETGMIQEIVIKCSGEEEDLSGLELSVCLNKKEVVREKRLVWNFRGNRVICVDGLWVDFMWDVFDWLFNGGCGCGVFLFRSRGPNSRMCLEEEMQRSGEEVEFSLLIYAYKRAIRKQN